MVTMEGNALGCDPRECNADIWAVDVRPAAIVPGRVPPPPGSCDTRGWRRWTETVLFTCRNHGGRMDVGLAVIIPGSRDEEAIRRTGEAMRLFGARWREAYKLPAARHDDGSVRLKELADVILGGGSAASAAAMADRI
ncbi:hypothetical protein [Herbidospora sp. RD11066]